MDISQYRKIRNDVIVAGYSDEIHWAQNVKPPKDANDLAGEAIWVILCSGMKAEIARIIERKVWRALGDGQSVRDVFGHDGKAAAIDMIWHRRGELLAAFQAANDKVEWCQSLPWIGGITKWHLAKNLGVDCAKPDRHLERIAAHYGTTTDDLCRRLAAESGDRIATVDLVLWRASNLGIIKTRELASAGVGA